MAEREPTQPIGDETIETRSDGGGPENAEETGRGLRDWFRRHLFGGAPGANEATSATVTITFDEPIDEQSAATTQNPAEDPHGLGDHAPHSFGEIARGGMAVIERARDARLRRDVALKRLRPELRQRSRSIHRFLREAQVTGQLDHPNIVPVHLLGHDRGGVYFTMKLVEGRTLSEVIEALPDRALEREELSDLIEIVLKICDALAFAHARGVLHCDIKPSNIMLADYGQVYLMDWGVAHLKGGEDEELLARPIDSIKAEGMGDVLGTPAYMSPEQAAERYDELDERTDVFALGALLYGVLARQAPYEGKTVFRVLDRAERGDYKRLTECLPVGSVPGELIRIIEKAMALEPGDRYATVESLSDDLTRFIRGGQEFPRRTFESGDVIIRQGEAGRTAFVVESGRCDVFHDEDGSRRKIGTIGPGEVFGEMAILSGGARSATIVAVEHTVLREVDQSLIEHELDGMKPWMAALVRTLADRFRRAEAEARASVDRG